MVERLRSAGHAPETLRAMEAVPRHRLVPEFWSHRAGVGLVDHRLVEEDEAALDFLYDERMPVGRRAATIASTISLLLGGERRRQLIDQIHSAPRPDQPRLLLRKVPSCRRDCQMGCQRGDGSADKDPGPG